MGELRLTIGLPGSGKTEYAKSLLEWHNYLQNPETWRRINWDDMRKSRGTPLRKFNRIEEEQMQKDSFAQAEKWGREGFNVIVDNTNLSGNTRNKWKGVAQQAGMTYAEIVMDVPLAECVARDAKRIDSECVGRAVIERMALFANMIKFEPHERFVLVDLDGTLADCEHRRHFIAEHNHDWDQFEGPLILTDKLREPIASLVRMFDSFGYVILIVSGRQIDRAGKNTVKWLEMHQIPYKHIFMRNGGDHRRDDIVKQEILDKLPKNQIEYVLDDRNQVVDMWRRNGLTCLQVALGDF